MCDSTEKMLSTREAADYLSVSESSIKRWVDRGAIKAQKTSGGHRKIAYNDLFEFIQERDPEKFQQRSVQKTILPLSEMVQQYKLAMQAGNIFKMVEILQTHFIQLGGLAPAIDKLIYPAFLRLRSECSHPSEECLVLHRAIDQTRKVLAYAKAKLVLPAEGQQDKSILLLDVGYEIDILPTYFAEHVLPASINAIQLGFDVPIPVLRGALSSEKPDYVWISGTGSKPAGFLKRIGVLRDYIDRNKTKYFRFGEMLQSKLPETAEVSSFDGFAKALIHH